MFFCVYLQILIAPSFDFDSQLIFLSRAWGMKVHQLDELSWVSGLLSTLDIRWRSLSLIWLILWGCAGSTQSLPARDRSLSTLPSVPIPQCQGVSSAPHLCHQGRPLL